MILARINQDSSGNVLTLPVVGQTARSRCCDIRATTPVHDAGVDGCEWDVLVRLDRELPIVDAEVTRLVEVLASSVDDRQRSRLMRGYQDALGTWYGRTRGRIGPAEVEELIETVHRSVPEGTDPVVVLVLDALLARLIEIGCNMAGGGGPLSAG